MRLQKPPIGAGNAFIEADTRLPAKAVDTARIDEFARRPVRFRCIERETPFEADNATDFLGQLTDRKIEACAAIDRLGTIVSIEQEDRAVGEIVDMQKFAPRRPRPPDSRLRRRPRKFGLMELAHQSRQHMARLQIEIVERAVEIATA